MNIKIGVLSDTHMIRPTDAFRDQAARCFADVSVILHAGDLTALSVLDVFNDKENIAKIISQRLEQDFKNNTGEFGTYANNKKLILFFDQQTQVDMEKTLSWGQYSSEPNG